MKGNLGMFTKKIDYRGRYMASMINVNLLKCFIPTISFGCRCFWRNIWVRMFTKEDITTQLYNSMQHTYIFSAKHSSYQSNIKKDTTFKILYEP